MSLKRMSQFDCVSSEKDTRRISYTMDYLPGVCHCGKEVRCDMSGNILVHRSPRNLSNRCEHSNRPPVIYLTSCPGCYSAVKVNLTGCIGAHVTQGGMPCEYSFKHITMTHTATGVEVTVMEES